MKKPPFVTEARDCEQGHSTTQGGTPELPPEPPRFLGTDNPRHLRVIAALLERPLLREEMDRIAGCSNGPALAAELRRRGLDVHCLQVTRTDRDGKNCRPGLYILTDKGRRQIEAWRAGQ